MHFHEAVVGEEVDPQIFQELFGGQVVFDMGETKAAGDGVDPGQSTEAAKALGDASCSPA